MTVELQTWLQTRGVPQSHYSAYRDAEVIIMQGRHGPVLPWHVDEAIVREDGRGASPRQLVNLKRMGTGLVEFHRDALQKPEPKRSPFSPQLPPSTAAEPGPSWAEFKGGSRCQCQGRRCQPRLVDGRRGVGIVGGISSGLMLAGIFLVGIAGTAALAALVMSVASLVGAINLHFECGTCGKSVPIDRKRRATVWKKRASYAAFAVLFFAASVFCFVIWLAAVGASAA
jgi:hypothetical protein